MGHLDSKTQGPTIHLQWVLLRDEEMAQATKHLSKFKDRSSNPQTHIKYWVGMVASVIPTWEGRDMASSEQAS